MYEVVVLEYDVPVPCVKPIGPTSMLNAAELEDQEMVAEACVVATKDKPIGSGHGGISVTDTSSIQT